jgi:hypothetical protein
MIAPLVLAAVLAWGSADAQSPSPPPILQGKVVDAKTFAPIAGALVQIVEPALATQTSPDGRFAFPRVPPGSYTLTVSSIGHIFVRRRLDVGAVPLDLTLPIAEGTGTYQEAVTVTAELGSRNDVGVSSQNELGSAGLQELRGVAADDPLRAVQSLPGVATGDDFQAEFSVRGSAFRHVGVVLDGTPTALLLHTVRGVDDTGSIAMINTDVLSRAALYAGAHPRRHGDWLGATLEFEIREGSRDRTAVRGAVSGTSASTVVEGPLGARRRGSWLVSIRKSYLDWLVRKIEPNVDSTIGFLDSQAKVVYDLTSRQQVQLLIVGGDAIYREEQTSPTNGLLRATTGSTLVSAAWRYAGNRYLFTERVSFIGSDFRNHGLVGQQLGRGYTQSLSFRSDVETTLGRGWLFDAGVKRERQRINEILRDFRSVGGQIRVRDEREISPRMTLTSAWAQLSRRTTSGGVAGGLRISDRTISDRVAVSPWIMAERRLGRATLRASAGASSQFPDLWLVPAAGESIGPERAVSVDLGVDYQLAAAVHAQLTAFDRHESNVLRATGENRLDPVRGTRIVEATFPTVSSSLDGTTRGVDVVLARRAASGPTGWLSYTWARTRMRDTLTGESFNGDFDQRHTLNVVLQQRLSYRTSLGVKLRVGSNFPIVGYFQGTPEALRLSSVRNQVRLPTYARLDLRASRSFTFDRRRLTVFVEVMNATGRRNLGQADGSIRATLEAPGYAERLIPRVPSAGILIEF